MEKVLWWRNSHYIDTDSEYKSNTSLFLSQFLPQCVVPAQAGLSLLQHVKNVRLSEECYDLVIVSWEVRERQRRQHSLNIKKSSKRIVTTIQINNGVLWQCLLGGVSCESVWCWLLMAATRLFPGRAIREATRLLDTSEAWGQTGTGKRRWSNRVTEHTTSPLHPQWCLGM